MTVHKVDLLVAKQDKKTHMKLRMPKQLVGCLLLSSIINTSSALELNDSEAIKVIGFADSVLECGLYYYYLAEGMKKNQAGPSNESESIAETADAFLKSARTIYTLTEVSISAKYEAMMAQSRRKFRQQGDNWPGISKLLTERGEECRSLLENYDSRAKEIMVLLERK